MTRAACIILVCSALSASLSRAPEQPPVLGVRTATPQPTAWAQTGARNAPEALVEAIVYTTLKPWSMDIYLFEGPEAEARPLTTHPALDYNAVFSPDGRWVVFTSERSGNPDLWAIDLRGNGTPVQITESPALDDAATFAPDGATLAFVSTRSGDADIHVMAFDPEGPAGDGTITNLTQRPGGDFNPAFSPDGRRIAYARQDVLWSRLDAEPPMFGKSAASVYVMGIDGSEPTLVVNGGPPFDLGGIPAGSVAGSPTWAPNGETLYYYRYGGEGSGIRRVAPDGSSDTLVAASGLSPTVGADGRVVFSRPDSGPDLDVLDALKTGSLVSVGADGSDARAFADSTRHYFAPAVDRAGRIVAHGVSRTPSDGFDFAPAGAASRVELPDRTLEVHGIRGYFPAITGEGDILSTPLHLPPPIPLRRSEIDGTNARDIFTPPSGTAAWGAATARGTDWYVVATGTPFAPGTVPSDIWKLHLAGSEASNLTSGTEANDALPDVSDDGETIVFRSGGDHGGKVFVMDADGGSRRRLTDHEALETMPALSPDGEWVVFPTTRERNWKLWIQRVDGSEGRFLEPDRGDIPDTSMHPRFSPDGKWVVFTSDRSQLNDEFPLTWFPQPYGELWAVPVGGGTAVRLTHDKWEDGPSDWGYLRLPKKENE